MLKENWHRERKKRFRRAHRYNYMENGKQTCIRYQFVVCNISDFNQSASNVRYSRGGYQLEMRAVFRLAISNYFDRSANIIICGLYVYNNTYQIISIQIFG